MRKSWVQVNGELIPKESYVQEYNPQTMIMPDIKPYKSIITGEEITSRSKHRQHLKQHGCFEIGNEKLEKKERKLPGGLKEDILRTMHQLKR